MTQTETLTLPTVDLPGVWRWKIKDSILNDGEWTYIKLQKRYLGFLWVTMYDKGFRRRGYFPTGPVTAANELLTEMVRKEPNYLGKTFPAKEQ